MEQTDKAIYEALAEITGKSPDEVEKQIMQSQQRIADKPSRKITIISGSFPTHWPHIE